MKINETGELTRLRLGFWFHVKQFFLNADGLLWMIRRGIQWIIRFIASTRRDHKDM